MADLAMVFRFDLASMCDMDLTELMDWRGRAAERWKTDP